MSEAARFLIPGKTSCYEHTAKKSRFLAWVKHIDSSDKMEQWLADIATQHPDARHVCWACITGQPGTSPQKCSDDGEPSGTAGKPILNVLQHSDCGEIAAVVVRYFGGIKLGAGGLVRAYSTSTAQALKLNHLIVKQPLVTLTLFCEFADEAAVRHHVATHEGEIVHVTYQQQVQLQCRLPEIRKEALLEQLPRSIRLQTNP